ncbi:protein ROOT HAIR DEFECTIVE 3 isoform X2 [Dendrobium catenatum]|nr:protein ROOT HAIR DEFECTIVE 3 isoform X2 [Dendrobium catenatum]
MTVTSIIIGWRCYSRIPSNIGFDVFFRTSCHSMLGHLRSKTSKDFKVRFEKALESGEGFAADAKMSSFNESGKDTYIEQVVVDTSKAREMLCRNINAYVTSVREAKLSEITSLYEEKLNKTLSKPVKSLLNNASDETWSAIRKLLQLERMTTLVGFASTLSSFDIDQTIVETLVAKLEKYAISIIESKAREEVGRVLMNMNDRFKTVFSYDYDLMPRLWTGEEDIKAITKMARLASLKLLSILVAIHLDEENDNAEETLQLALMDILSCSTLNRIWSNDGLTALTSNTWKDVSSTRTLITPVQCMSLWRQFKKETKHTVKRAIATQETYKRKNNQLPPWAIVAMLILGFNELITILRNPSYLWAIFFAFLLGKALWVQLDISDEFQNGVIFGILSLSLKFLSTLMNVLKE